MKVCVLTLAVFFGAGCLAVAQDLDGTLDSLKQAGQQKDAAQAEKLAANIFTMTHAAITAPEPTKAEDKQMWQYNIDHAKEVQLHTEYELSALAFQGPPATTVELLSMIEKEDPKSKYLDGSYDLYLRALTQTGASAKVVPAAEKGLANFPDNPDLLQVLASSAWERKQMAGALTYSRRLIAVFGKRAKPEGMSDADWQKKKDAGLGRAYWMIGMISADRNLYADADRNLRAALPLIKGNDAEMGPALYALGLANYQLGKMTLSKAKVLEGAKFSKEAAGIAGPQQQQAWHNANVMTDEAAKMR
jgi:hypothetical protein